MTVKSILFSDKIFHYRDGQEGWKGFLKFHRLTRRLVKWWYGITCPL